LISDSLFDKVSTRELLVTGGVPSDTQKNSTKALPTNDFFFENVNCEVSFLRKTGAGGVNRCQRKTIAWLTEWLAIPKKPKVVLRKTLTVTG
jgi:hypothetical protein